MNIVIKRAALTISTVALLALPLLATDGTQRRRAALPVNPSPAQLHYATNQVEAYLTPNDIAFIRPGLKIIVNSVTIGSDRKPVIDVSLTDDLDQPLDRLGKTTPGAISVSFILAWYDPATRQYTSYTADHHDLRRQSASGSDGHAGRYDRRNLHRSRDRSREVHVDDRVAVRIRPDEDAHARHLFDPEPDRGPGNRSCAGEELLRERRVRLSGPTAEQSPTSGTRSTRPRAATTATTRSPRTAAHVRT